jgi:hypothetical protein
MKAGQQLVFGEQIGWFDPGVAGETNNLEFLRKVIHTRWNVRRYFHAGEMARPLRLIGAIPKVKADWQWSGEWWVTTDAVLTGAWSIPGERRVLVLFVNVSDQPLKARLVFNPESYGLNSVALRRTISRDGQPAPHPTEVWEPSIEDNNFEPQSVQAWELTLPE